jgi:hypothetical protein
LDGGDQESSLYSSDIPFSVHMVTGTNNQFDFLGVIADFIEVGYLVGTCIAFRLLLIFLEGDTLVMDN